MTDFDIVNFYNGGAQVQSTSGGIDMTNSFTADGDGETVDHGYVPKANSKLVEGPSYDTVSVGGKDYLLLKAGYTYDVELVTVDGEDNINEVIGAPEDHVTLPLPSNIVDVNVGEHEEPDNSGDTSEGTQAQAPELGDGTVVEETPSATPEQPTEEQTAEAEANGDAPATEEAASGDESGSEGTTEAEGTLGTEEGAESAPANKE